MPLKLCCTLQPFQFVAGKPVFERKARKADGGGGGGSFSGLGGPKPPPALSTAVLGMAKGSKVLTFPRLATARYGLILLWFAL